MLDLSVAAVVFIIGAILLYTKKVKSGSFIIGAIIGVFLAATVVGPVIRDVTARMITAVGEASVSIFR